MARVAKTISGFEGYSHLAARIADASGLLLGGFLAYWLRFGSLLDMVERYQWMMLSGMLLGMVVFGACGIYRSWRGAVRVELVVRIAHAFVILAGIVFTYLYFTKTGARFSRLWLGLWLSNAFLFSVGIRTLAYPLLNRIRRQGRNRKGVILVGELDSCLVAAHRIAAQSSAGFDVTAVRLVDASDCSKFGAVDCRAFDRVLDASLVSDEIWVCLPLARGSLLDDILRSLDHCIGNVRYMPDMQGLRLLNHDISTVAGLYLLDMSCTPMSGTARFIKAAEDKLLAGIALVLVSPVMIAISLAVKLTSRGPVFYHQERMSWNGESFQMLKFRSMAVDSESEGISWGGANCKRVTPVGRFLRRSSLDELPQLINVIKGDMSLVGPRPERTVFVERFKHEIPGYMQKHMVLAGITGWAQIHGWRGDTDLKSRIEHDLWYIDNWSIWLDFKILFLTMWRGFFHPHAR
ncbi:undecaprenyl-phosphate glucose phosphotransferase [Halomonas sp. DP8Y7-3]|uniref:undecaprenyl-phosphate glucose phosphotransferase n=1 Tax=Halomonas sp. DP8Y7-3 TaxID=2859079 RepID=UPI001C98A1A6|nr:undecaprenyl-phosphate glucose phosphotransferase [Halomonas sp. DP8Y7-3]MBY5930379.1 undecaprenyl-phosphate glucose phosphotransferase [Halomonas sp. DP8Y7-3]